MYFNFVFSCLPEILLKGELQELYVKRIVGGKFNLLLLPFHKYNSPKTVNEVHWNH